MREKNKKNKTYEKSRKNEKKRDLALFHLKNNLYQIIFDFL